jgi:hypothetical protein
MKLKQLFYALTLAFGAISVHAQTSITLQGGIFSNKMNGGFTMASSYFQQNLSAGISIDHSRGKVFGWMIGYSAFAKSFQFGYPYNSTSTVDPMPSEFTVGYNIKAHEIQSSLLMRLGKHINLSAGPYIHINTNQIIYGLGIDENFFYPALPKDLYNSIEFGYQGKLQLQFFIGRRFYVGGYANAGMSLTDLRTKAWNDAWSIITGEKITWTSDPMKDMFNHFGLCVGIRTKQKTD